MTKPTQADMTSKFIVVDENYDHVIDIVSSKNIAKKLIDEYIYEKELEDTDGIRVFEIKREVTVASACQLVVELD